MNKRLKQKRKKYKSVLCPGSKVPLYQFWSSASGGGGMLLFALVFAVSLWILFLVIT